MKSCLVVDDSTFDRSILASCMKKLGYEVREASSGADALVACQSAVPDCVILDWEMPGMNGIELLGELRQMKGAEDLRVLICTSHDKPSFIGHAYVSGVDGYVVKPVSLDKMEEKLGEAGLL